MRSLQKQMNELLKEYGDAIQQAVEDVLPEVSANAAKELRQVSPQRTGNYSRGWRATKLTRGKSSIMSTVYNDKYYRLTHLLEYGHANRDGGRTKAQPHIQGVEESASEELVAKVAEAVGRIK